MTRSLKDLLIIAQRNKGTRKPAAIIHPKHFEQFLDDLENADMEIWFKAFLGVAVFAGLRVSEVLSIKKHQIDFDLGTITIKILKQRDFVKNAKGKQVEAHELKRTFLLHPNTLKSLSIYINNLKIRWNERVFDFSRQHIFNLVQKHFGKAASPHTIARHSQISWLLFNGKNATQIGAMKGMAARTVETYAHVDPVAEILDICKMKKASHKQESHVDVDKIVAQLGFRAQALVKQRKKAA